MNNKKYDDQHTKNKKQNIGLCVSRVSVYLYM